MPCSMIASCSEDKSVYIWTQHDVSTTQLPISLVHSVTALPRYTAACCLYMILRHAHSTSMMYVVINLIDCLLYRALTQDGHQH
jgi:hypothetical protein